MRAVGRFFPCPRTARSRVCVRVRVRACASYMVLPSFPWRASRSVHDGRRPFFSTSPRTARSRVRVRACASYMVLPSFPWRASRSVHDGRRPFFPVSTYSPFTGPCTCVCVVHGFAQFSMARVTFRPRRPSAVFFTCPRTACSRVRVRVRARVCASYVVLPSFPWRASRSVHDGRRPFFPVSTYSPFTGPCTCVCVVHGFAQFSMGRVTFRPRRASAVFSRVHVQPVHGSVYVRVRRTWFCPVFHGARHVPSTTGVGRFFHVSTYSPFKGPCKGPCTSVCLVRGFAQFSMARVTFRPRRASAVFFTCPRTARSRVRVRARVRPCASYVVLPSFPWRASRFVHDGRRPFFPVSTYSPFTGPCKGPCTSVCLVRGFAQFSMARVTFRP